MVIKDQFSQVASLGLVETIGLELYTGKLFRLMRRLSLVEETVL